MPESPLVWSTARLDLRLWGHDEVAQMYDIYRRWEVARWLGAEPKVAESVEAMHATVDRWAARTGGPYGIWAIVLRASGDPVGTLALNQLPDATGEDTDDVEVGWHLHPDRWGNGYATEAALGGLERAWAASIVAVHAVVRRGNTASVAVTRRLGMSPRGATDRWYGTELDDYVVERPAGYQGP